MEEIFETYGDMLLAIIAAVAFYIFLNSLIGDTGMLNKTIQENQNAICMLLPTERVG
jgi:hypothetical protein